MEGISSPENSKKMSTKAISFKAYIAAEKPRIKAAYPFLSAEQINRKVKDLWKRMNLAEKQNYTKSSPKITPVKGSKRNTGTRKKTYETGKKCKSTGQSYAAELFAAPTDVCDSPDYVNAHKLRDFHKAHEETYYNDFSVDNPATGDGGGGISDSTPIKQPGILKNSDSEKKLKQASRVSFNSQPEEHILSQYSHHTDDGESDSSRLLIYRRTSNESNNSFHSETTGYVNNSHDDDSDDDGGILIKRDDDDGDCDDDDDDDGGILIKRDEDYDGDCDDDDDNDEGILIRREQNGIEDNEINDGTLGEIVEFTESLCVNMEDKQECFTEVNNDMEVESVETPFTDTVNSLKHRNNGKKSHGNLSRNKTDKLGCRPENEDGELTDGLFRSPLQDTSKNYGKRKGNQAKKQSSMEKLKTPTQPSGMLKAGSIPQVTPNLTQKEAAAENYTTPQMDDVLQKLTLKEVNKAPQKQRQCQSNQHELGKAAAAGRRVTRSLLCSPGNEKENNSIASRNANADTGDKTAKLRNVKKQEVVRNKKVDERCKKNSKARGEGDVRNCGMVIVPTNPSGDACQDIKLPPGYTEDMETEYEEIKNDQQLGKGGKSKLKRSKNLGYAEQSFDKRHNDGKALCNPEVMDEAVSKSANKKMKLANTKTGLMAPRESCLGSPELDSADWSQGSILDICSSPDSRGTGASPGTRLCRRDVCINPTLQRALLSLKSAAVISSPTVSLDTGSGGSSPRLLSPALSGLSELSSASSSQSSSRGCRSDVSLVSLSPQYPCNTEVQMGDDLCRLFDDVKPGDRKMPGPYVTKRMAASNTSQHQEIFEDDPEFPFT